MRSLSQVAGQTGAPFRVIQYRSRVWQWTWRVALFDFEQHRIYGVPIGRERFMAEAKKRAKWGDDKRYWTRAGRSRMNKDWYWIESHVGWLYTSAGLARWELEHASQEVDGSQG